MSQLDELQKQNNQMQLMTGIGQLRSAHLHADVKVYVNGQPIDFSQRKYQLATSIIHFEDGIGDVIHTHATGLTIGRLLKSVKIDVSSNCITIEGQKYCNEGTKKLKFYVNNKQNSEFDNYVIIDLDKYLISYGNENESEIQKQLNSVTNLAQKYSVQR